MSQAGPDRRRIFFTLAVAVLVLGFLGIRILVAGEDVEQGGAPRPTPAVRSTNLTSEAESGTAQAAVEASTSFLRAYLDLQVGIVTAGNRSTIRRTAAPSLWPGLVDASQQERPTGAYPRERVLRVAGIAVGLHQGEPALRIGVWVAGGGGRRVLTVTLVRRAPGWLVVEVAG